MPDPVVYGYFSETMERQSRFANYFVLVPSGEIVQINWSSKKFVKQIDYPLNYPDLVFIGTIKPTPFRIVDKLTGNIL